MADPEKRHPRNVAGAWFVDSACISCDTCTDISPEIFWRDDNRKAYVQAVVPELSDMFRAALESCPVEAVGDDADPTTLRPRD